MFKKGDRVKVGYNEAPGKVIEYDPATGFVKVKLDCNGAEAWFEPKLVRKEA